MRCLFSEVFLETHHHQSSKVSKFPKKKLPRFWIKKCQEPCFCFNLMCYFSPPQQLLDRFLRRSSLSKSDSKNTVILRVSASPPARMLPIAFHHRRKGVIPDNPQQPSTLVIVDPPPPLKVEGLHSDLQILMEINSSNSSLSLDVEIHLWDYGVLQFISIPYILSTPLDGGKGKQHIPQQENLKITLAPFCPPCLIIEIVWHSEFHSS